MARQDPQVLLDPRAVSQAESLGLQARFVVEGYMSGEHKSPFRGFAMEFTQHREYVSGDDTRHIDWKVLGRTDRLYLKQYEQETNYVANILLDGSESMKYSSGSISKLQYGKMIAACLSYLILRQRDATAVGIFDDTIKNYLPRTSNQSSVHNIMDVLAAFNPVGQTNIGHVLHDMAGNIKRKGIVIIISDLFDDEQKILEGIQHLRFDGHEVIVFHTMDRCELDFPFEGLVEFNGLEKEGIILTRPNEVRRSYLNEIQKFKQLIKDGCERNNCHYVPVNTSQPLSEMLSGYLAFRMRTSGSGR